MPEFAQYWVAVDLGQINDFTGIAVMERAELTGEWDPAMFAHRKDIRLSLRYLERVPRGTPYTEIVERVREVTEQPELRGRCQLIVDATGCGVPVVDMLRAARLGCGILPVMVTSGHMERQDNGYNMVPKRDLIVGLQVVLQQRGLWIAGGMEYGQALTEEMMDMRVKISTSGNEQFGAWREGEHDDLVFAVSMACWGVRKMYPNAPTGENAYMRRMGRQADLKKALGKWWRE